MKKYLLILVAYIFAVAILIKLCKTHEIDTTIPTFFIIAGGGLLGYFLGKKMYQKYQEKEINNNVRAR